jgi:hypothetical protein
MPSIRGAAFAFAAALLAAAPPLAASRAEPPVVVRNLQGVSLTMFEFGIKSLRRSALDASLRFASPAEPGPAVRVWYDAANDRLELLFDFRTSDPLAAQSRPHCIDKRRQAIMETFKINRTDSIDLSSPEQRIRRRLGMLFSSELQSNGNEVLALGERLAEMTFVEVEVIGSKPGVKIACRGAVAQLDLR